MMRSLVGVLLCAIVFGSQASDPGSAERLRLGREAIADAGCGACHVIPGAPGAAGTVGPSLRGVGSRVYLAGQLPNTPANMATWIAKPQSVLKGVAMPDTGLTPQHAQIIAAYLEGLK